MIKKKKCRHCGKHVNVKYIVCPFCGGQFQDVVTISSPECPRCKVSLEVYLEDSQKYNICPKCGGLWLDKSEFHRVTRKRDVYKKTDIKGSYLRGSLKDRVKYIPCVRCGKLMNRKNFAKISGVIIDECRRHGVWLDAYELDKIRHFIADGGLERSQDMEIEKVRLELSNLRTKVDQAALTQKIIHFWNLKRWIFGR